MLHWQWPWALPIALVAGALVALLAYWLGRRAHRGERQATVYDLDEALKGETASALMRTWRAFSRVAAVCLVAASLVAATLMMRPSEVSSDDERSATRDIVLCLDVSGSTLPYDRQVIETYQELVQHFKGERIGLSIFNSTSRTVFPLTDDYDLVASQLKHADELLGGVQSQDNIDKMSDKQYQEVSDWLAGTQNRKNQTSLIGDGLVSCAAMLPGFTYAKSAKDADRDASIVLATDNVVSGKPTYTLAEALKLTSQAGITVDGLYSGPTQSEGDEATTQMKSLIEEHGGIFLTQSNGQSVQELVRSIDERRAHETEQHDRASYTDAPGWFTLAIAVLALAWLACAWRVR